MKITERVAALRAVMKKNNVAVFIVYSADPHMSEYLPTRWQEREWISGFTGSAGFAVITADKAGLWTDGRYFTQAEEELKDSGIKMFKDKVRDAVDYVDWILKETAENDKIAVNALATAHADWQKLKQKFAENNRELVDAALLEEVWTDRKTEEIQPVFVHPLARAGKSLTEKLNDIRAVLKEKNATAHVISSLDDVAWTLNLRGSDVECNPVFLGYILLTSTGTTLFVNPEKLTHEAENLLKNSDVTIKTYDSFFEELKAIENERFLIADNCNQRVFDCLKEKNEIQVGPVPGNLMKALKNEAELKGFEKVMVKDGVAMVNFLYWLKHQVGKEELTEYEVSEKLLSFRKKQENFVGISFASIIGFQENGAIIHYKPKENDSKKITKNGSVLIDSGGQYLEGTTDITRTLALGEVSEEFKHDYTLVLKAHIQLAMAKFPSGTRGDQLDVLARLPLWEEGKDFNHGTGHGIGSFLNVHEGPQSIRKEHNPFALQPGMVLSNEPGYYMEGKYGIRHENLMVVEKYKSTEWNDFYEFKTITLCPFFTDVLDKSLLTESEIDWVNDFHKTCQEKLGDKLEGDVKDWFMELVKPI